MFSKSHPNWFPIWPYLNQPLFDSEVQLILNPGRYWQEYRIQYLNRCWKQQCEQNNYTADG